MKVDMRELRDHPVDLAVHCAPDALELGDDEIQFDGPVDGTIHFQLVDDKVLAKGRLSAHAKMQCVRCLCDVSVPVSAAVEVMYENDEKLQSDESQFLGSENGDIAWFDGDTVHPAPQLREALMLEVPAFPVCSESCKGLCPVCGVNRNEQECSCGLTKTNEVPWKAALKNIKL